MKTQTLLMAAMAIFTACSTNKSLTKDQLVSSIKSTDKVGIITMTISEDQNENGSSIIGQNSYYYVPDRAAENPYKKGKEILVMDTLMRMVESKYSRYIGKQLVPAKVGTKIPAAGWGGIMPCLPKQTVSQAIKSTDLDKMITVSVGWSDNGGATVVGISTGNKKPKAIIITKVYDRSGKKIWERTQKFDPGLHIKNRGVKMGSLSFGGVDGMTGNQLLDMMAYAFDATFLEEQPVNQGK